MLWVTTGSAIIWLCESGSDNAAFVNLYGKRFYPQKLLAFNEITNLIECSDSNGTIRHFEINRHALILA